KIATLGQHKRGALPAIPKQDSCTAAGFPPPLPLPARRRASFPRSGVGSPSQRRCRPISASFNEASLPRQRRLVPLPTSLSPYSGLARRWPPSRDSGVWPPSDVAVALFWRVDSRRPPPDRAAASPPDALAARRSRRRGRAREPP